MRHLAVILSVLLLAAGATPNVTAPPITRRLVFRHVAPRRRHREQQRGIQHHEGEASDPGRDVPRRHGQHREHDVAPDSISPRLPGGVLIMRG